MAVIVIALSLNLPVIIANCYHVLFNVIPVFAKILVPVNFVIVMILGLRETFVKLTLAL